MKGGGGCYYPGISYYTYPTRHGHRRLEPRGWVATCGHRGGLFGCGDFVFFMISQGRLAKFSEDCQLGWGSSGWVLDEDPSSCSFFYKGKKKKPNRDFTSWLRGAVVYCSVHVAAHRCSLAQPLHHRCIT